MSDYIVGIRPFGFGKDFFSEPMSEGDAADLVLDMSLKPGYEAHAYRLQNGRRERVNLDFRRVASPVKFYRI